MFTKDPKWITILAALTIGYNAWGMIPVSETEDIPDFYDTITYHIQHCSPDTIAINHGFIHRAPIKWWLDCASFHWFHNVRILPMILNIGVMPLVYLLALRITGNRLTAFIALNAFLLNPIWMAWKNSITYDQTWTFFLLLSLVLLYSPRLKALSAPVLMLSILSKSLTVLFVPMYLYMVWTGHHTRTAKILITVSLVGISSAGITLLYPNMDTFVGNNVHFRADHIEDAIAGNLAALWEVTPFMLGVVGIMTMFRCRAFVGDRKLVAVWMLGILISTPLIYLFTDHATFTYRYVQFAAFLSILFGMAVAQLGNFVLESRLRLTPKAG